MKPLLRPLRNRQIACSPPPWQAHLEDLEAIVAAKDALIRDLQHAATQVTADLCPAAKQCEVCEKRFWLPSKRMSTLKAHETEAY